MDLNVINYTVPFNNTEIWELTNQSAISHPFHIHDVQFYILTRNGVVPPANEQGRKDVVLVKPQETVRFIAKFETFSNETVPYMYHCHLLTHEDGGMMGQFIVSSPLSVNENNIDENLVVYPNPSNGLFYVSVNSSGLIEDLSIYDNLGRFINISIIKEGDRIRIEGLPNGTFFLKFRTENKDVIKKIIIAR